MSAIGGTHEAQAARQLWVAVLARMVTDCFDAKPSLEKRQAWTWIGSRGFCEVCDLAGVCPRRLAKRLGQMQGQGRRRHAQTVRQLLAGRSA